MVRTATESLEMLNKLVSEGKRFLKEEFDLIFDIPVEINTRLSKSWGRFQSRARDHKPLKIEISMKALMHDTEENLMDVMRHECVHYALCAKGLPYRDSDHLFKSTCERLHVPLNIETGESVPYHHYVCGVGCDFKENRRLAKNRTYKCNRHDHVLSYNGYY